MNTRSRPSAKWMLVKNMLYLNQNLSVINGVEQKPEITHTTVQLFPQTFSYVIGLNLMHKVGL